MTTAGGPVKVLISYAHESADHKAAVRRLWLLLRSLGIDAKIDITAQAQRQFWPEWMAKQIHSADFVLVVASAAYRERAENSGDPAEGQGVRWEARLIQDRWYADPDGGLRSIVPVILPGESVDGLPTWLLPTGATFYELRDLTPSGVERLLRIQPLAVADPGNSQWQRDLSISRNKLGNVAVASGDLAAAWEHFQAALEIAQRLAAADPTNSEWQRDSRSA